MDLNEQWIDTKNSARNYTNKIVNCRKAQWKFLASVYLYHKAFMLLTPKSWKVFLDTEFNKAKLREPSASEFKRPFLALLHLLLTDALKRGLLCKISKMVGALECIDSKYNGKQNIESVVEFIENNGGVVGLYTSRNDTDGIKSKTEKKEIIIVREYVGANIIIKGSGKNTMLGIEGAKKGKHLYNVVVDDEGFINSIEEVKKSTAKKAA